MPTKAEIESLARFIHETGAKRVKSTGRPKLSKWTELRSQWQDDYRAVAKAVIERFQATEKTGTDGTKVQDIR